MGKGFGGGYLATCYLAKSVEDGTKILADKVGTKAALQSTDGALEVCSGTQECIIVTY